MASAHCPDGPTLLLGKRKRQSITARTQQLGRTEHMCGSRGITDNGIPEQEQLLTDNPAIMSSFGVVPNESNLQYFKKSQLEENLRKPSKSRQQKR